MKVCDLGMMLKLFLLKLIALQRLEECVPVKLMLFPMLLQADRVGWQSDRCGAQTSSVLHD